MSTGRPPQAPAGRDPRPPRPGAAARVHTAHSLGGVREVHGPAAASAAGLVPARDEDRRDIEAGGGHEVARGRLVAGGKAHHPVELRPLYHDLYVVDDEVAGWHQVAALLAGARHEVARGRGADLEGQSTRLPDRLLDYLRDPVEVHVAYGERRGRVYDRDLGFVEILLRYAHRPPLCSPYGPAGATGLEFASEHLYPLRSLWPLPCRRVLGAPRRGSSRPR